MSILQELLNVGLVDIGSDDSRFEKMQSTSTALAARFKEKPGLLVPATLISLDEDVDENDPMFALVEDLVVTGWKTLRNTHVNRPRSLLRSIIIDALAASLHGDPRVASVVWNTAAGLLRHGQARLGKAGPVIELLLREAGAIAEAEAVAGAGLPAPGSKKHSRKNASSKKVAPSPTGAIKSEDILADVAGAVGPQIPVVPNLENPNPNWPTSPQPWANDFTPRMATALTKAVNLGTSRLSKSLSEQMVGYLGELEGRFAEEGRDLDQLQTDLTQAHESSRMRLDVLWWSYALYSPSRQLGYRELPLPVAAVAAALDVARIVPPLTPASVCYVLGETILRIARAPDGDNKRSLSSYLEALADAKTDLGDGMPGLPPGDARWALVDMVGEAARGARVLPEVVRSRTGIDAALALSPAELSMWVFRGVQANRLVESLR